jgi:hypothetical protein
MMRELGFWSVCAVVGTSLAGCPSSSPQNGDTTASGPGMGITIGDGTGDGTGEGTGTQGSEDDGIDPSTPADDTTSGEMNCGEQSFVLQSVPPNVALVLDRSGSMKDFLWDADGSAATPDITRWNSLYNVVALLVDEFDAEINLGAAFFPSGNAFQQLGQGACITNGTPEVAVTPLGGAAVLAAMPPAESTDLVGATPATSGVESALEHLLTLDPTIDRFMILVTDGAANCGSDADTADCPGIGCDLMEEYDERLPVVVGDAFETEGIPTYVVGIDIADEWVGVGADGMPGTADDDDGQVAANTFDRLNDVAVAGGRALGGAEKFFNAQNEIELQTALQEIAGQVFSCTVELDPAPENPDFVEIEIGGMPVDRVTDCETEDGWTYTNPDGPYDAIQLCGAACDMLGATGELDATFACPPPG